MMDLNDKIHRPRLSTAELTSLHNLLEIHLVRERKNIRVARVQIAKGRVGYDFALKQSHLDHVKQEARLNRKLSKLLALKLPISKPVSK